MPAEPPPTRWSFPPADAADEWGVVGVGADLEPGTILAAYRQALFPMPIDRGGPIAWWSPDPRGILVPGELHVSRSLRRSLARFELRVDTAFLDVVTGCADPRRPHGWIDARIARAYERLHRLGFAHSIEAWTPDGGLAGGLYGVALGGLFAAESKFHRERDASKVALAGLCSLLADVPGSLVDVQWLTPHLASLGAREVPRARYLELLDAALAAPLPRALAHRRRRGVSSRA
ncbi:MAG: leucyl/phenylalanyl-tRNA--protein transferase [Thermoleophilia bacterium]